MECGIYKLPMRAWKHEIAFFKFNCPFKFLIWRQGWGESCRRRTGWLQNCFLSIKWTARPERLTQIPPKKSVSNWCWVGLASEENLDMTRLTLSAPRGSGRKIFKGLPVHRSVEGKIALSSESGVWPGRKSERARRKWCYSREISHLIALDLSLTFYHTVCLLWICHRGRLLLTGHRRCSPQQPALTPACCRVSNPVFRIFGPQQDLYLMLTNLFPSWTSESWFTPLGAFSLQWVTSSPNSCRSTKNFSLLTVDPLSLLHASWIVFIFSGLLQKQKKWYQLLVTKQRLRKREVWDRETQREDALGPRNSLFLDYQTKVLTSFLFTLR